MKQRLSLLLKGLTSRNKKAFTLIELLVVIAIIGILAALVIVALNGARLRASDTQTKNNIRSLATALEQYNTDRTVYPITTTQVTFAALSGSGAGGACPTSTTGLCAYVSAGSSSAIFTSYTGLGNKYISDSTGTSYLAATGLRNTTEATVSTGSGERITNSFPPPGYSVSVTPLTTALTVNGITSPAGSCNGGICSLGGNHAWVIYGPQ